MTKKRDQIKMQQAVDAYDFLSGLEGVEITVATEEIKVPAIEASLRVESTPPQLIGAKEMQQIRQQSEQMKKIMQRKEKLEQTIADAELKIQRLTQSDIKAYLEETEEFDFTFDLLVPSSLTALTADLEFQTATEKKEFLDSVSQILNRYSKKSETEPALISGGQNFNFEKYESLLLAPCVVPSNSFKNAWTNSSLNSTEMSDLLALINKINGFYEDIDNEYDNVIPINFSFYDAFVNQYIGNQEQDYISNQLDSSDKQFVPSKWRSENPFGDVTARYSLGKGKRLYIAKTFDNKFELIAFDNNFGHVI